MKSSISLSPTWYAHSHHARYRRLGKIRRVWGRYHAGKRDDHTGQTVYLDGTYINDIPGFYLSLGEAVNGPSGYFGADLGSLADCLCGGFGVLPPLAVRLSHFDDVRQALDGRAWCRFQAEGFHEAVRGGASREQIIEWGYGGDGSKTEVVLWAAKYEAALVGEPFDCDEFGAYFDAVREVFATSGAELVPHQGSHGF